MKTKIPGFNPRRVGEICPRCGGNKPMGDCGKGIALSRRAKIAICSDCGTAEAIYDAGLLPDQKQIEDEFRARLESRGAKP